MTEGALAPKLLRLAGPLMAANVLQTIYNLVDMFWVGRLGATSVAAVAIVFPTQWLLISMGMGVTIPARRSFRSGRAQETATAPISLRRRRLPWP